MFGYENAVSLCVGLWWLDHVQLSLDLGSSEMMRPQTANDVSDRALIKLSVAGKTDMMIELRLYVNVDGIFLSQKVKSF